MSTWEPQSLAEVVQQISDNKYVLPVIQRSLVWNEPKMELLFDSLLKRNSFGGIMVLEEERAEPPLFAFRKFSRDGEPHASIPVVDKLDQTTRLVIDGQQRLQSFYMGLVGSINQKSLYYNLLSSPLEYEFEFCGNPSELPLTETSDNGDTVRKFWYSVNTLFNRLKKVGDSRQVANEIKALNQFDSEVQRDLIEDNVYKFFLSVFVFKTVGISLVTVNKTQKDEEKQRIVELFRRLNDGGTRLSSFDLVASVFKGFDYRMELFFKDIQQFSHLGVTQDEVIKLIFLLQDMPSKEVTQIRQEDADFVIEHWIRIINSLKGLEQFLKNAELYNYYSGGNRSVIPLYFITYHIFHKHNVAEANLERVYDNYDTNNPDFLCLKRWLHLSILNGVFSRGVGWIPYRTGIRKILRVLQTYKGQQFPVDALFDVYAYHPIRFTSTISPEKLDTWDSGFVFYLLYNRKSVTGRDVDHIHPKSLLSAARSAETGEPMFEMSRINSMANYQLLDIGTNRGAKQGKELKHWLENHVTVLESYLQQHLIPTDPKLWTADSFDEFAQARARLITEQIQTSIPEAIEPSPAPLPPAPLENNKPAGEVRQADIDKVALREQLPAAHRDHPILNDTTTWFDVYKQIGYDFRWAGRYRKTLRSAGIETVADFALFIMVCKLQFWFSGYADVYDFYQPTPDGHKPELPTREFAGWGWKSSLNVLSERGFDWQEFVVDKK